MVMLPSDPDQYSNRAGAVSTQLEDLANAIREFTLEQGASLIGFADISGHLVPGHEDLTHAVSLAVRVSDAVMDEVVELPTHAYFHHYRTLNAFLDQLAFRTALKIQQSGFRTLQIASSQSINTKGWHYAGLFPHRTAAALSGLGWIGKNNSLITREFGPRVRLATILTNAPFIHAGCMPLESECGDCQCCIQACPPRALTGNHWTAEGVREAMIDPKTCSDFMHKNFQHIGRGAVCGICIQACPLGSARNRK
jgi:epoxyqueuosine reductase QueG